VFLSGCAGYPATIVKLGPFLGFELFPAASVAPTTTR
jgi:hypothetical protein